MLALLALLIAQPQTVTIEYPAARPLNVFDPREALGAGVDGHEKGDVEQIFRPGTISKMRSAGFGPLTYRLRTELAIDAWHWNPNGSWSDSRNQQGYWTSSSQPHKPILESYGYKLPRRGSTTDEANDDGYSRILDGDTETFWKSNPYLDRLYTGEPNRAHPGWIVLDLGRAEPVDAIRILWGMPFAVDYRVDYWQGENEFEDSEGQWTTFPGGFIKGAKGGRTLLRLASKPISVRFVRLRMLGSSGKAPGGWTDVRDGLGYAVRELYLGTMAKTGLQDLLRHGRTAQTQTKVYVSSTDPWHSPADLDPHVEQPGFDRVFNSGLTNGLSMLTPVSMLFGTPEDSAAQLRYLRAKGYPVRQIEMGEEPDGQFIEPEDYGALYIQWADALHKVDPRIQLGGPCYEEPQEDVLNWPRPVGAPSWTRRFIDYLRKRRRLNDLAFLSMEWYPYDDIGAPTGPQLLEAPDRMIAAIARLRAAGVPQSIPWLITEYGYSAFAGQPEVDIEGALLNADIVGTFLSLGGNAAYLYGYEPSPLDRADRRDSWGNNTLFLADDDREIVSPVATYFGARMLTKEWALPTGGRHELYAVRKPSEGVITAYPVRRPDGTWSVMLVNKDPHSDHSVYLRFRDGRPLAGMQAVQFSRKEYEWQANGPHGKPIRAQPPERFPIPYDSITLPAYSLTVVHGSR